MSFSGGGLLWFLIFGAGSSLLAQFQSDTRLNTKLDRRTVASAGGRGVSTKEGLDISLVTSLAYDDNILQAPDEEVSSAVLQIEPSIGWTYGERDKNWIRLAYEGAAVIYFSSEEDNRIDNRVTAEGVFQSKSVTLAYSGRWARLGSPSADIGGASDRNEYGGEATVTYSPTGKLSYSVFGERSVVDQVEPSFFDSFQTSGGAAIAYRYSSKTELELAYRFGRVEVEGSDIQTFQRIGLQGLWRPRPKLSLSIEGGVEFRDYESGPEVDPFLSARLAWNPRPKTALFLEAFRRVEASGAVVGENFDLTGFRAGVTQQFSGGWSATLEVGRETADYFSITNEPGSGREDIIAFIRPSVRYAFNDGAELILLYQWSENDSTDPDFGFNNQQIGLSMNYSF